MSINGTLIAQMIVFAILVWFTMSFVWPPIATALDERAKKIAEGLSAADKAKSDLAAANQRVEQQLAAARTDAAKRLADPGCRVLTLLGPPGVGKSALAAENPANRANIAGAPIILSVTPPRVGPRKLPTFESE